MSKSMAIEGVMKIFLMVAVIIVGMSFLLKAFGIDIFEWLKERFAGFGIVDEGVALHVKFDPDQNEIFEFHLTEGERKPIGGITLDETPAKYHISEEGGPNDKPLLFGLEKLPENGCLLLTTDENGGGSDSGRIYVVKPGTTIQASDKACDSLRECILNPNILERMCTVVQCTHPEPGRTADPDCRDNRCVKIGECSINQKGVFECKGNMDDTNQFCFDYKNYIDPGPFLGKKGDITINILCDQEEKVLDQSFSGIKKWSGGCKTHSEGKRNKECELLKQQNLFTIDFGLVCDGNKWKACTSQKAEKGNEIAQGKICKPESDYFFWEPLPTQTTQTTGQAPLCTYLDNTDCPDNKPIKDICTGECKPSSSCTFQGPCLSPLVMNPCTGECVRTQ